MQFHCLLDSAWYICVPKIIEIREKTWDTHDTLNKILVEVSQMGLKDESPLVMLLVTWGS